MPSTVLGARKPAVKREGPGGQGHDTNSYLKAVVENATEWKYLEVCDK